MPWYGIVLICYLVVEVFLYLVYVEQGMVIRPSWGSFVLTVITHTLAIWAIVELVAHR